MKRLIISLILILIVCPCKAGEGKTKIYAIPYDRVWKIMGNVIIENNLKIRYVNEEEGRIEIRFLTVLVSPADIFTSKLMPFATQVQIVANEDEISKFSGISKQDVEDRFFELIESRLSLLESSFSQNDLFADSIKINLHKAGKNLKIFVGLYFSGVSISLAGIGIQLFEDNEPAREMGMALMIMGSVAVLISHFFINRAGNYLIKASKAQ